MPATFPAHQGLVAALKLWFPRLIDGTALCIGAAAPDLAYALGDRMAAASHHAEGAWYWGVPFTLVAWALTRWRAADGVARHLPDLGPLRLRSYRVLGTARPSLPVTLVSAVLGVWSHVVIDAFTHEERWGAQALGFDRLIGSDAWGFVPIAQFLQYAGHVVGSLIFAVLLVAIASKGRLEQWYGADAVAAVRADRATRSEIAVFWAAIAVPTVISIDAAPRLGVSALFLPITVGTFAVLLFGTLAGSASLPIRDDSDAGEPTAAE